MESRMKNPAVIIPEAMEPIKAILGATYRGGVAPTTLTLVHLRASQIKGCSSCVDSGWRHGQQAGESLERMFAVAAWRDAACFTDAERAALALAECATRLADRVDPVPQAIWEEAAKYYDERGLAALLLHIAMTNVFNRPNVSTRQVAGAGWE